MSIYVITGGTTGIGAEARKKLQDEGHEVFNIDYNGGDYTADLSTDEGRKGAVKAVFLKYPDGIDGVLCNAGVGPTAPPKKIFALNFFAAIAIAEGLRPLLKKKGGNCVVTSSNSITNATVKRDWVDMLSNVADENATNGICRTYPAGQNTVLLQLLQARAGPLGTPRIFFLGGRRPAHQRRGTRQYNHSDDERNDGKADGRGAADSNPDPLRPQGIPRRL